MENTINEIIAITKMSPPLCWEGYKALAQHSSTESLTELVKLAENKDWTRKRGAVEAIGEHKYGMVAEDFLIDLLNQNNDFVKKASIVALAKLKSNKAHDKIKALVNAADQSVREKAITALGSIWEDEDLNFLMNLYQIDANGSIRKEIGLVLCEKINEHNWYKLYTLFSRDKIVRHRHMALSAIGKFGNSDISLIELFLHDKDGHIRKDAEKLLKENSKKKEE